MMKRLFSALVVLISLPAAVLAASGRQPAPPGAFKDAPPQYTRFSTPELMRGFLALAFGSDLSFGTASHGIRRFDHPIRATVIAGGSVDRTAAMQSVVEEYAAKIPNLHLSLAPAATSADIEVRLIDEKDFRPALRIVFGANVTRTLVARTDPQCITYVKSGTDGAIVHAVSFIIVDKGDAVFLDCSFHELLHAFGLSNHDQRNPWTTLNQHRTVGYMSVYDRSLLTLLYDPRLRPGMNSAQARAALPDLIRDLGLAGSDK
ncbi:MAG TPA: DUF2927 domain-containing protein [Pseudolabrys sp.]|jgi:hypothetical protein